MKVTKKDLLLAIVPLFLIVLSFQMFAVRGAYNLGLNLDPEYVALFNSLNLATARLSYYFQHPATTTQILATFVIWAKWLFGGFLEGSITDAVLKNHLDYLRAINLAHVLLLAGVAFLAGRRVWRASGSVAMGLAVQLSPLMYLTVVEALPRVAPELMEVIVGLALVIPLAPVLLGKDAETAAMDPKLALVTGTLLACGIATKANFLTLGLLVLVFPGWKQKARFTAACGAATAVLLVPVAGAWRELVGWFYNMAVRSGVYGKGDAGLPETGVYWENLAKAVNEEKFVFYLLGVYVALLVALLWGSRGAWRGRRWRALAVGALMIVTHTAITAKHYNYHYILPAAMVTVMMNVVAIAALREGSLHRKLRIALAVLFIWVGYEGLRANVSRMLWYRGWKQEFHEHIAKLIAKRNEMEGCRIAGYYNSSAPTFALSFGNSLSADTHHQTLERVYPDQIHVEGNRFLHWDHRPAGDEISGELDAGQCVLLQGQVTHTPAIEGYELEPVYLPEGQIHGAEALYRVRPAGQASSESPDTDAAPEA